MRCARCNREMGRAFVDIKTKAGPLSLGPTCARKAGMLPPKEPKPQKPEWVDPNQLKLEL